MENNRVVISLLAILVFIGCSNNKSSDYTNSKMILKERPLGAGGVIKYSTGKIKYLIDSVEGKEFGYFFNFYQNGYLKTLYFKIDSATSTYTEKFDSISHKLINRIGNPIIYETIDADSHQDSMYFQYLISNFSFYDITFELSGDGKNFNKVLLTDYPKLKFVKTANFSKRTKDIDRIYMIVKVIGKYKNDGTEKIFYDTIDYSRTNRAN